MSRVKYLFEGYRPDRVRLNQNESGMRSVRGLIPVGPHSFREAGRPVAISTSSLANTPPNFFSLNTGSVAAVSGDGIVLAGPTTSNTGVVQVLRRGTTPGDITPASYSSDSNNKAFLWAHFVLYGNTLVMADGLSEVKGSAAGAVQLTDLITSATKPIGSLVAVVGDHLLLAGTAGAGGLDSRKFFWSGRGDPTDFEPGSNRAGFAFAYHDIGPITGMIGFSDYGLLFGVNGVVRLQLVSGATLFDQSVIASGAYGTAHPKSIVAHGGDVYYLSRMGFTVLRQGASPELLPGEANRELFRRPGTSLFPAAEVIAPFHTVPAAKPQIQGVVDPSTGVIFWLNPSPLSCVCYDPLSSEWTVLFDEDDAAAGSTFYGLSGDDSPRGVVNASPLWRGDLGFIINDQTSGLPTVCTALRYDSDSDGAFPLCAWNAESLVWSVGQSVTVTGVRPIYRNEEFDPPAATPAVPANVSVQVKSFVKLPIRDEEIYDWSASTADNTEDDYGFVRGGDLPVTGEFFVFRLSRAGSTDADDDKTEAMIDIVGFDIEYTP